MNFPFQLPTGREFDASGFGTNAVDFLIRVPEYPAFNSKIELVDYSQLPGGEIATAMTGLQRLGLKTCYAGRFGDDFAGRFGIDSLLKEGVDTTYAEVVPGALTQIAFIVIDEKSGERTVIWKRDSKLSYAADEAPLAIAERSRVVHITQHDTRACVELAKHARSLGTVTSIDLDNLVPGLDDLLPNIDILITSAEVPARMFGIDDKVESIKALQARYGSAVVGITLGEEGSIMLCDGQVIRTHGYPVPSGCKDTTGAGDSFRAGFLYGLLTGCSVEESARMANGVASLKCRAIGARTSLPTRDELESLINKKS